MTGSPPTTCLRETAAAGAATRADVIGLFERPARPAAEVALVSAAVFPTAFQTNMIAPLIPLLAVDFHVTPARAGVPVPAFALPYAGIALAYGALVDRIGRRRTVCVRVRCCCQPDTGSEIWIVFP